MFRDFLREFVFLGEKKTIALILWLKELSEDVVNFLQTKEFSVWKRKKDFNEVLLTLQEWEFALT